MSPVKDTFKAAEDWQSLVKAGKSRHFGSVRDTCELKLTLTCQSKENKHELNYCSGLLFDLNHVFVYYCQGKCDPHFIRFVCVGSFPVDYFLSFLDIHEFSLGFISHFYPDPSALDLGTKSEGVGFKSYPYENGQPSNGSTLVVHQGFTEADVLCFCQLLLYRLHGPCFFLFFFALYCLWVRKRH